MNSMTGSCFSIYQRREYGAEAQEDSTGLTRYYEEHKADFLTKKGIEARIYTLRLPDGDKKLASTYRKYSRKKRETG